MLNFASGPDGGYVVPRVEAGGVFDNYDSNGVVSEIVVDPETPGSKRTYQLRPRHRDKYITSKIVDKCYVERGDEVPILVQRQQAAAACTALQQDDKAGKFKRLWRFVIIQANKRRR